MVSTHFAALQAKLDKWQVNGKLILIYALAMWAVTFVLGFAQSFIAIFFASLGIPVLMLLAYALFPVIIFSVVYLFYRLGRATQSRYPERHIAAVAIVLMGFTFIVNIVLSNQTLSEWLSADIVLILLAAIGYLLIRFEDKVPYLSKIKSPSLPDAQ